MGQFFSRERFGKPQVLAGFLLLMFAGQCVWLLARGIPQLTVESGEFFRVQEGLAQWQGESVAGTPSMARAERGEMAPPEVESNQDYDPNHSPLWYLTASAPLLGWQASSQERALLYWTWFQRVPCLIFGLLLGASLWYVSRRLYGNAGGYIALGLYCFSPAMIHSSTLWLLPPEMGAAWSAFGAVFTAIAVAHTLYAPREVVLWNWRRILLLGLSLALAIGSQFSLIVLVPLALAFMLYLAPTRWWAALAIWASACAIALALLFASYSFHSGIFWQGMRHASFLGITGKAFAMPGAYRQALFHLGHSSPALLLALPATLIAFAAMPRARYFGNIAPLLVALLFLGLAFGSPHYPGLGFWLVAAPFLFVFVAGVAADLLETRQRALVQACIWGLLIANALWNLAELTYAGRG
ncbi:MAG: hypothetical protein WB421_19190 [Terriglobales bacterium]|jgi:hypothetical protein